MTYEQVTNWWKQKENKNKVVVALSLVLVFVVGFGAGRYERSIRRNSYKPQNNYTTQTSKKPTTQVQAAEAVAPAVAEQGTVAGIATTTSSACVVKGNISTGGRKIYHVVGGAFYKIVKAEMCFKTEAEAVSAGFVKSGR